MNRRFWPYLITAVIAFPSNAVCQSVSIENRPPTAELVESCVLTKNTPISCRYADTGKTAGITVNLAPGPGLPPPEIKPCIWLPSTDPTDPNPPAPRQDATTIASLLGAPYPYAAVAQGPNELLIYRVSNKANPAALRRLNEEIFSLYYNVPRVAAPAPFTLDFQVPHAATLGDLAARVQSLNSANLTAQDVGGDMVRVTSAGGDPDCKTWGAFIDRLHRIVWSVHPDTPIARVFFHQATDVSNALAGTNAPGAPPTSPSSPPSAAPSAPSSPGSGSPSAAGGSATSAAAAPAGGATGGGGPAGAPASGSASTSASSTGTGSATISISQPAGTKTTLNMVTAAPANANTGLPSSPSAASTPPAPGSPSGGAAPAATPSPAAAKPAATQASLGQDALIFADTTTGDDSLITEKKRILAAVDLPRPEMLINTWILQQSTNDSRNSGALVDEVRTTVYQHNEALQEAVRLGWDYLRWRMIKPDDFFNMDFYNYVVPRVVFDATAYVPQSPLTRAEIVTRTLRNQDVPRTTNGDPGVHVDESHYGEQNVLGICKSDRYCLGYTTFFQPLQPSLTTMLMAILAAKNPANEASCAVSYLERLGPVENGQLLGCNLNLRDLLPIPPAQADQGVSELAGEIASATRINEIDQVASRDSIDKFLDAAPDISQLQAYKDCATADEYGSLAWMYHHAGPPIFFMECFRRAARAMDDSISADAQSSLYGLARAAVADFLFHYKMSQQYPHEFNAYDLTTSAQAMNAALRPLIDAFNRDLVAYQQLLQIRFKMNPDIWIRQWYGGGKNHFVYNALVTVHTLSGSEAMVDTTTESYLDTLSTPTASALLNSINSALQPSGGGGGGGGGGSTTTTSTTTTTGNTSTTSSTTSPVVPTAKPTLPTGVLSNLSLNQAQVIVGALSALQSSHVHIGREVFVDVVPEALSQASSAELQVTLHADDSSSPPAYTVAAPAGVTDPEISRFSKSELTTRIRVDSVKMFEVSSFAAVLDKSRSNFPLIPPLIQLPYIGSLLSFPVRPAKEFHSNIAVMSAVIIPTANDLALGIRFVADRLIEPPPLLAGSGCYWPPVGGVGPTPGYQRPCKLRPTISLGDFAGQSPREFHRRMIHCLATSMHAANANSFPADHNSGAAFCRNLTYDQVPTDAN